MAGRGVAQLAVPLYAGMVLAWGFNYVAVRWGLAFASPLLLALLRAVIGSVAMLAFLSATRALGALDRRGRRDALLIGLPTTAIFYGLWFVAAGTVEPGLASILVYTFPLWVSLLSGPVLGVLPRRNELAAVALGFVGVGLATEPWRGSSGSIEASAELLLGAVSWAFGTVLFKRRFRGAEVQEANLYQLMGGSLALGAGVVLVGSVRFV
ncbi:MAG TPA: DMT family transporter, partial [Thermoplasmata archaeon]|nr:DMT family transporter [Thermoplasmata archaeon]